MLSPHAKYLYKTFIDYKNMGGEKPFGGHVILKQIKNSHNPQRL